MKRNLLIVTALLIGGSALAQSQHAPNTKKAYLYEGMVSTIDLDHLSSAAGGAYCDTAADYWNDLNGNGAPCDSSGTCVGADAGWTTFGSYGSECYIVDNFVAGYDYVYDGCMGVGAGDWVPELVVMAPSGTVDASNAAPYDSTVTFASQCNISFTASESGSYRIFINQLGTAAGDAPDQADCLTSFATSNGNPTMTCGPNAAPCGASSIIEAEMIGLSIYPNPSNGSFVVTFNGNNAMATVNVTDLAGKTVYTESVLAGEGFLRSFDLDLNSGTYLFNVINENTVATKRILIK